MVDQTQYILGVALSSVLYYIFALIAIVVFANLIQGTVRRALDPRLTRSNAKTISNVLRYTVIIVLSLYATQVILGFDLAAIGASLGIITIIIAFSSQQIIQNILAGILILIYRPIRLEDWISLGGLPTSDIARVVDMTLTNTVLEEIDGSWVILPNNMLLTTRIVNYTRSGLIEVPVKLVVKADSDLERIRTIIRDIAAHEPWMKPKGTLPEHSALSYLFRVFYQYYPEQQMQEQINPRVLISDISGGNLTLDIRIWIDAIQIRDDARSRFLDLLFKRMKKEGIAFS